MTVTITDNGDNMIIDTFKVGNMDNKCYLITDEKTKNAVLVDASFPHREFVDKITALGDKLKYILLTHGHYDHILSAKEIHDKTGAKIVIHKKDAIALSSPVFSLAANHGLKQEPVSADILVDDGDVIKCDSLEFKVIYTPGHTIGCVCYICQDAIFSGDTLFRLGVGRTDLPTGNYEKLIESLIKLYKLNGDYKVYPGHDKSTTLDIERTCNQFMLKAMNK